jgi:REP element-mobilizing transposase RayT
MPLRFQNEIVYLVCVSYNPRIHARHSIRLRYYDYARPGAYFITICTFERQLVLGEVANDGVNLSEVGQSVREEWLRSAEIRGEVNLGEFVVMPNHFHAIVMIDPPESRPRLLPRPSDDGTPSGTLSSLVAGFKAATTRRANAILGTSGRSFWQHNYHERVIRDDDELKRISEYVVLNPLTWADDPNHPTKITPSAVGASGARPNAGHKQDNPRSAGIRRTR